MDITTQINLDGTVTIDAKNVSVQRGHWDSKTMTAHKMLHQGDLHITIDVHAVIAHLAKALYSPDPHVGAMNWAIRARAENVTETEEEPPHPLRLTP